MTALIADARRKSIRPRKFSFESPLMDLSKLRKPRARNTASREGKICREVRQAKSGSELQKVSILNNLTHIEMDLQHPESPEVELDFSCSPACLPLFS